MVRGFGWCKVLEFGTLVHWLIGIPLILGFSIWLSLVCLCVELVVCYCWI